MLVDKKKKKKRHHKKKLIKMAKHKQHAVHKTLHRKPNTELHKKL